MTKFKELDRVIVTEDLDGIPKGSMGTIVHCWNDDAVEVEIDGWNDFAFIRTEHLKVVDETMDEFLERRRKLLGCSAEADAFVDRVHTALAASAEMKPMNSDEFKKYLNDLKECSDEIQRLLDIKECSNEHENRRPSSSDNPVNTTGCLKAFWLTMVRLLTSRSGVTNS